MLPFVSRARHDRELAALERLLAHAEQRAEDYKTEAREAHRLHELERRRFDALLAQREASQTVVRERSKLTQAIREQSRMPDGTIDPRLVNHFRGEANKLLNQGKGVEDAMDAIAQWQTTEHADRLNVDAMIAASRET